jgi:hypothetical protein
MWSLGSVPAAIDSHQLIANSLLASRDWQMKGSGWDGTSVGMWHTCGWWNQTWLGKLISRFERPIRFGVRQPRGYRDIKSIYGLMYVCPPDRAKNKFRLLNFYIKINCIGTPWVPLVVSVDAVHVGYTCSMWKWHATCHPFCGSNPCWSEDHLLSIQIAGAPTMAEDILQDPILKEFLDDECKKSVSHLCYYK